MLVRGKELIGRKIYRALFIFSALTNGAVLGKLEE